MNTATERPALAPPFPLRIPPAERAVVRRRAARALACGLRRFGPVLLASGQPKQSTLRALRRLFEDLGATYMKFGQLLGSAPGVFGEELSAEFRSCLDAGPPIPAAEVVRVIEAGPRH